MVNIATAASDPTRVRVRFGIVVGYSPTFPREGVALSALSEKRVYGLRQPVAARLSTGAHRHPMARIWPSFGEFVRLPEDHERLEERNRHNFHLML
jgi:hypothetical protein